MRRLAPCTAALCIAAALSLGGATRGGATSVPARSFEEVAAAADVVGVGVVRAAEVRQVGRRIITFYDVDLIDIWRGRAALADAARVTVGLPGGTVHGVTQQVAGTPALAVGGKYLFALGPAVGPSAFSSHARATVGLWQGVLAIDARTGAAAPAAQEVSPTDAADDASPVPPVALPVLKQQITSALGRTQ